jgi:hypothetical protein
VHLMIETPTTNLGRGMQWLHGNYARSFNDRHVRTGHLFGERYKSPVVGADGLVRVAGYIALNPVRAALRANPSDWPWSSHADVTVNSPAPTWLAHDRLTDLLAEIDAPTYADLVAAREREDAAR